MMWTGPRWLGFLLGGMGLLGGLFMVWGGTELFHGLNEVDQAVALPGLSVAWGLTCIWSGMRLMPGRKESPNAS